MAAKSKFTGNFSFNADGSDNTYSEESIITVDVPAQVDATLDSQAKANLAAIAATGIARYAVHPNETLAASGVRALSHSVQLLQDKKALVSITWGVPLDPILDGDWVYEVQTIARTLTRGLDIDGEPIKIKYVPTTIAEGDRDQFLIDNARTNNRGASVQVRKDLIQVIGRRHISFTAALKFPQEDGKSLFSWPKRYINHVNEAETIGETVILTEGQWMCNNMRIYSKNHNWSFIVEASFIYDVDGHEEFVLFIDRFGLRPKDVKITDNMKLPWPPETADRESPDEPYGASRPQVLPGTRNFKEEPFGFRLGGF